jgi:predicted PhzF superfamily epimerase YddE/YHI9
MELELFQVDAFCKDLFSGNPAAVCPLDSWPEDGLLQNIAAENNLAETAYYVHLLLKGISSDCSPTWR